MHIVVLLAGVVDPRWRLSHLALRAGSEQADEEGLPRRLSPFDEAALEIALKLRDADPAVRCTAIVMGDASADPLVRAVLALRPHRAFRFDAASLATWDPRMTVRLLGAALDAADEAPALVLMGREFGDADDGVLPPLLAEARGLAFWGQAHALALVDGGLAATRMRSAREEVARLPSPALVSITNDRGNRLRHPLMKNVIQTKRAPIDVIASPPFEAMTDFVALSLAAVPPARRGSGECRVLSGPLDAQVDQLAAHLRAAQAGEAR